MTIPPFSIFSAISELFVTAGVIYVVRRNWNRQPFPFALFIVVSLFEALVNVMYMANRSAAASAPGSTEVLSTAMKIKGVGYAMSSACATTSWPSGASSARISRSLPGLFDASTSFTGRARASGAR